jgi:hypothetical protein
MNDFYIMMSRNRGFLNRESGVEMNKNKENVVRSTFSTLF